MARTSRPSVENSLLPSRFARLRGLIILMLAVVVCSCAKPQRTLISTSGANSTAVAIPTPSAQRVNINTAKAIELETLPGVGKVLAERIVAHRERNGPFRRTEHLMMVRGFSENKFRAVRERVTLE